MSPKALITGITGQDGSYLAELLLDKGYKVDGIIRRSSTFNTDRIEHLYKDPHDPDARLRLHYGDLTDGMGLREVLTRVQPDEVNNLGAQSHVRVSFDQPRRCLDVSRAKELFGFQAQMPFDEGLRRTIGWLCNSYAAKD